MTISSNNSRFRVVLGASAIALASAAGAACSNDDGGSVPRGTGGTTDATGGTGGTDSTGSGGATGDIVPIEGNLAYRVDQFGYLPNEEKVAVIGVAVTGFDAPTTFTGPGGTIEVRSTADDSVVFSGAPSEWNAGAEDALAGDRGYWFDFSSVTTPGEYYLADVDLGHTSVPFRIADDVYHEVLVQAMRTFYYQREGFAKEEPYADARWTDGASHANDAMARSVFDKENADTERDVSGGWMDAGDQNKYVNFVNDVLPHLFYAYRHYPQVFTDDTNIPESGNGVADVIDEADWEVKYLLKMQDDDGGVFIKSGSADYNDPSPPSADMRPRYYGAKCTSSTISFAAMIAEAAVVYDTIPALEDRVDSLSAAAVAAWDYFSAQPELDFNCDKGEIKSGDADFAADAEEETATQLEVAVRASYWLWVATGEDAYHTYFSEHLGDLSGVKDSWWGPYRIENGDVLIEYVAREDADAAVVTAIQAHFASMAGTTDFFGFVDNQALYRAYMPEWSFHWGSTRPRVHAANLQTRMIDAGASPDEHAAYLKRARAHTHWMHGVNALSKVYLTNMGEYGAENDCTEIYHTWFVDGSQWDSTVDGIGPPPGYVPGGPNTSYVADGGDATMTPPANQPGEKSYADFNDAARVSWAITENSITYQAPYIRMLASVIASR